MGGTALDTSVIVPALLSWHEHHAAALPVVQEALADAHPVIVPLAALIRRHFERLELGEVALFVPGA